MTSEFASQIFFILGAATAVAAIVNVWTMVFGGWGRTYGKTASEKWLILLQHYKRNMIAHFVFVILIAFFMTAAVVLDKRKLPVTAKPAQDNLSQQSAAPSKS